MTKVGRVDVDPSNSVQCANPESLSVVHLYEVFFLIPDSAGIFPIHSIWHSHKIRFAGIFRFLLFWFLKSFSCRNKFVAEINIRLASPDT